MANDRQQIRADKWLWYARFFKTRSLAAKVVAGGHVRVNSGKISKPAHGIGPGDTLTFPQGRRIRVVRVVSVGVRRGPANEAQALYEDLSPASPQPPSHGPRPEAGGRPTKKERRNMQQTRNGWLE